jgi:hypothetical protein
MNERDPLEYLGEYGGRKEIIWNIKGYIGGYY